MIQKHDILDSCTDNEQQEMECVYSQVINKCIDCKRYYINLPDDKEDFFKTRMDVLREQREQNNNITL